MIPDIPDGLWFTAMKDCCQHYSGEARVIRQKKGGMYLCEGVNGEQFEETKRKIVQSKMNDHRKFLANAPSEIDGWKEAVL